MREEGYILFDTKRVKSYAVDETYSSRMLLDDSMVGGRRTVQINEGTVAPGAELGGGTHTEDEIYYIVSGRGTLKLGSKEEDIAGGYLVFIPAGLYHAIRNTDPDNEMVLLTLWREPQGNDVYEKRLREWGASFVLEP